MLLVKTKIAASPIHGIGLFAAQRIPRDTEVWRFTPELDLELSREQFAELPGHIQEFIRHYGYLDFHLDRFILCFDNSRFINHSESPNITPNYELDPYGLEFALQEIAEGEEITIDYRLIEVDSAL
jgi:uncharacterized protein